jgi:hypothetical protein
MKFTSPLPYLAAALLLACNSHTPTPDNSDTSYLRPQARHKIDSTLAAAKIKAAIDLDHLKQLQNTNQGTGLGNDIARLLLQKKRDRALHTILTALQQDSAKIKTLTLKN